MKKICIAGHHANSTIAEEYIEARVNDGWKVITAYSTNQANMGYVGHYALMEKEVDAQWGTHVS